MKKPRFSPALVPLILFLLLLVWQLLHRPFLQAVLWSLHQASWVTAALVVLLLAGQLLLDHDHHSKAGTYFLAHQPRLPWLIAWLVGSLLLGTLVDLAL